MDTPNQTAPLLMVADMEASLRFYRDQLGFTVEQSWAPEGKVAWCWLGLDGAALMLQQDRAGDAPAGERGNGVTFYIVCADAYAAYERITAHGVAAAQPETTFYGMLQTHFRDPDGYALCFESRV